MATLEVHDEQGRVRFVELNPEHPMLFGTSETCDIHLAGEGILPVHGRIRWKKRRFKVEASPGAQFVLINGKRMAEASLHQGDELTVGPCRIFMFQADDEAATRTVSRPAPRPDDEPTVNLEEGQRPTLTREVRKKPPRPPADSPTLTLPPPSVRLPGKPAGPTPPQAPAPRSESPLEHPDWLADLIPEKAVEDPVVKAPGTAGGHKAKETARKRLGPSLGAFGRWVRSLREPAPSPGEERLLSSPLVITLVASIALLVALGLWLRTIIATTLAERSYHHALGLMEDGDFRTAIREWDAFLAANPEEPRVDKARVMRAMANVRQYISISGATWSTALEAARQMYDEVGNLEEFRDAKTELAELVIRIGEGLADRARRGADAKALVEAESAVPLHASLAGEMSPAFLKRSRLPELLGEARSRVRKAEVRSKALAAMDRALDEGSSRRVYQARDRLVEQYADLAQDADLVRRMVQANDLVRKAVKTDPARYPVETGPRRGPLGPPTSLVLRSGDRQPATPPAADTVALGLADGQAFGIDAATGAPLWQVPVGLASPFVPVAVPGDPSALAFDAQTRELLRLDIRDGRLNWRVGLGEAIDGPPLIIGQQLYQVLPGGKLVVLSLETGETQGVLDLGLPATRTPVSDELGRFLYVIGRHDCLFVIGRDPLACVDVEYLGHDEGSIPCAAARVGRFLIVVENDRIADSRWRVMLLEDDGARPHQVQSLDVPGWTWQTPASAGSYIWATGDRGGIEVFALGDYASKTPLRSTARQDADKKSLGPTFARAASDRELWVAGGRPGRYELDPDRGQLVPRNLIPQIGPALGPVQFAGRRVVLTLQDSASGGTALIGLDRTSGAMAWRTDLGTAWPTPLSPRDGSRSLATISQTGRESIIPLARLEAGGMVTLPLPNPGTPKIPQGRLIEMGGPGGGLSILAPPTDSEQIWLRKPGVAEPWRRVDLPAPAGTTPLPWGRGLLVPGGDGRAYFLDPQSGRSLAEPLVPEFSRDRRGRWRAPALIAPDAVALADTAGRIRRLGLKGSPTPRLTVEAEALLDREIVADPACTGGALVVMTADGKVRSLSTRDLTPVGAWSLDAPPCGGPTVVDGHCFVLDAGGGILAIREDGRRLWSTRLDVPALGRPVIRGDSLWIADRSGKLRQRSLADGGARRTLEAGALAAGSIFELGDRIFFPSGRGTIRPVDLGRLKEGG